MSFSPSSKIVEDLGECLSTVADGATVLVGGFGDSGIPFALLKALRIAGKRDLTLVSINAGSGSAGIAALIDAGQVSRIICSFPRTAGSIAFEQAYRSKRIDLELVPLGTLVERLRAGGSGIPAFYTPVAVGTDLAIGKESRDFDGRTHILEHAIRGDLALVRAQCADPFGNLVYRGAHRNLNPVIAKAATRTLAEVSWLVELGEIPPEDVTTPGGYVDHVIVSGDPVHG